MRLSNKGHESYCQNGLLQRWQKSVTKDERRWVVHQRTRITKTSIHSCLLAADTILSVYLEPGDSSVLITFATRQSSCPSECDDTAISDRNLPTFKYKVSQSSHLLCFWYRFSIIEIGQSHYQVTDLFTHLLAVSHLLIWLLIRMNHIKYD